jgi:hypothetical protein
MLDVLGRELEAARALLTAAGFQVEVEETRSPRRVMTEGALRVIRQTLGGASTGAPAGAATVRLVVTRERYVPIPRDTAAPREAE